MTFDVFDRRTKKVADARAVIREFYSGELNDAHGSFATAQNGELLVLDLYGGCGFIPESIFTVEWVDEV